MGVLHHKNWKRHRMSGVVNNNNNNNNRSSKHSSGGRKWEFSGKYKVVQI